MVDVQKLKDQNTSNPFTETCVLQAENTLNGQQNVRNVIKIPITGDFSRRLVFIKSLALRTLNSSQSRLQFPTYIPTYGTF